MAFADLTKSLFDAAQGVAVDVVREKLNVGGSSEKSLITERQQINQINGSGAPSSREALRSAETVEELVTEDPVKRASMFSGNLPVIAGLGLLAFFVFKK